MAIWASSRNWQKSANHLDWKVCWHFFLIFCVFFQSSLAFINLLWRFFVARALQYFLELLLNICPLSWLKPDLYVQGYKALYVCSSYLYTTGKKHHIRNSNKKPLRGPGYRLVNAVKLSLQSGRNTQLGTCIILVIFRARSAAFGTQLTRSFPTTKNANIYDVIIFKGLSFQNTLIRNCFALLFLLVPGQDSQENLLVRQALCTSRAWQFHSPGWWKLVW